MVKREKPIVDSDDRTGAGVESTRQRRTDSLDAAVLVEGPHGMRELRIIDLLGELADDMDSFERVGAMRIGEEVMIHHKTLGAMTVRRVR